MDMERGWIVEIYRLVSETTGYHEWQLSNIMETHEEKFGLTYEKAYERLKEAYQRYRTNRSIFYRLRHLQSNTSITAELLL